jgi:two-component system, response regulator YesN
MEMMSILKLAIVDDERLIRTSIKKHIPFDELSLQLCFEASDGLEALELCKQFKPDILITDIRMPGLNGIELIQELNAILPDTGIIIISGYSDFEYAKSAMKYGVSDYLIKPVNQKELTETLIKVKTEIVTAKEKDEYEQALKSQYEKAIPTLVEKILNKLIIKNTLLNANILQEFKEYGIHFDYPNNLLILISPDEPAILNDNPKNAEDFKAFIIKVSDKYLNKGIVFSVTNSNLGIAILLNHEYKNLNAINRPLHLIAGIYKRKFKSLLSFSYSSNTQNLIKLEKLFEECCLAMDLRFWDTGTAKLKLYPYQQRPCQDKLPVKPDEKYIEDIVFKIKMNSTQLLEEDTDMLFKQLLALNSQHIPSTKIKEFIWVMIRIVSDKINVTETFVSYQVLVTGKHPQEKINGTNSIHVLKQYFKDMLLCLCNCFKEDNDEKSIVNPLEIAKRIIQQNYSKDISLELISNYVHLSQAYFSDQFKKETGMSFTQYKTLLKIENAKKLIQETNYNLSRISIDVGYYDPKYFFRMFKKITGLTPNEFKEQFRSNMHASRNKLT